MVQGLIGGPAGASLGCVLLWSGSRRAGGDDRLDAHRQRGRAAEFADDVDNMPRGVRAGTTAIGEALLAALQLLDTAPAAAARQVMDVVGDGRSNDGVAPGPIRDRMAAAGITINGLCVLHEEPDLLQSYTREVIGGPGAFALQCADYRPSPPPCA